MYCSGPGEETCEDECRLKKLNYIIIKTVFDTPVIDRFSHIGLVLRCCTPLFRWR